MSARPIDSEALIRWVRLVQLATSQDTRYAGAWKEGADEALEWVINAVLDEEV